MMDWTNKAFVCAECGTQFNTRWTLKRHSVTHQEGSTAKFDCDKCNKCFSRKDSLDRHQQVSHSSTLLMYMCSENGCGKIFGLKSTLQRHKSSHVECFECDECGSSFARKDNLARHKALHSKKLSKKADKNPSFKCNVKPYIKEVSKPNDIEQAVESVNKNDEHSYALSTV